MSQPFRSENLVEELLEPSSAESLAINAPSYENEPTSRSTAQNIPTPMREKSIAHLFERLKLGRNHMARNHVLNIAAQQFDLGPIICVALRRDNNETPVPVVTYSNIQMERLASAKAKKSPMPFSSVGGLRSLDWSFASITGCSAERFRTLIGCVESSNEDWQFSLQSKLASATLMTLTSNENSFVWTTGHRRRLQKFQEIAYHLCLMLREGKVQLGSREIECLEWAAEGKSAEDTAKILGISKRGVQFHLNNARAKLDALNITHAVAKAYRHRALKLGSDSQSGL